MLEDASNRTLLEAWRAGDQFAAGVLVRRYMARLTALARSRMSRKLARRLDSEDIVLSAWRSFFTAAGDGHVVVPTDDNLWPLLVTMTVRKLARQAARHSADRRSFDAEAEASGDWQEIVSRDPSPVEAATLSDEVEHLMSQLAETDREILSLRLQGEEQSTIAARVGCSERTVRRSLQRTRELYLKQAEKGSTVAVVVADSASLLSRDQLESVLSEGRFEPQPPTINWRDIVLQQFAGQGAFGRVYRSTMRRTGETVAVKFLRKSLWSHSETAAQFVREVAIVSALSHEGIVQHFGWGHSDHGAVFSVMEWIDGCHLEEWQRTAQPEVADVVECAAAVCEALNAAHAVGVVHADLTPRNVLRSSTGRFVLTDFGFSRVAGDRLLAKIAGTPGFLAPEQLCDAFGAVSPRTDVFGLGGILYFLLTGRPPITGRDSAEMSARTLSGLPVPRVGELVSGVPESLQQLISDCLSKEPADRPDTTELMRRV